MSRAPLFVVLGLFALAGACKSIPPAERKPRSAWLSDAKIETLGSSEAFAKNSARGESARLARVVRQKVDDAANEG